jgi:hypothetical protein
MAIRNGNDEVKGSQGQTKKTIELQEEEEE